MIDLKKGLYIGSGIDLNEVSDNKEVQPFSIYLDWKNLSGHTFVLGTTRVGKTRLMMSMLDQIIQSGWDALIVEPKGAPGQESIGWILEFAEKAGRLNDINYMSPMYESLSMSYNPLYYLSNEEIASMISTLIPANDEFFITIGFQITMAVLLGLEFLEKAEGKEGLNNAIQKEYDRINKKGNVVDEVDPETIVYDPDLVDKVFEKNKGKSSEFIKPPYRSLVTFYDLMVYSTQEGIKALLNMVEKFPNSSINVNSVKEENEIIALKEQAIQSLKEQASKDSAYFSKISSSFSNVLGQLSTGRIGQILNSVKINPFIDNLLSKEKGQITIVQPFPLIFQAASDMFVKIFFGMLTALIGRVGASGRELPRKFALMIDEGGSVLYPGVENLFNKGGALGLRIFVFTQSFADYDNSVGPEVAKIIGDNTNIKIYLRMNHQESRQAVSDAFGEEKNTAMKYMGSKTDVRMASGDMPEVLVSSAHISQLKSQFFLLEYDSKKYLVKGPFQPDTKYYIEMPYLDAEKTHEKFTNINKDVDIEKIEKIEI